MSKIARQKMILELVETGRIGSQDELRRALARHELKVTQATLSRDIHEIGLVKTADGYALPQGELIPEPLSPPLERMIREFVLEVRVAQNLLVLKASPGTAQPVAVALDSEGWLEVVGTVAGDDTVLIITPDKRKARALAHRLSEMLAA
jgi:transcriptional regulator of arginine metabolism